LQLGFLRAHAAFLKLLAFQVDVAAYAEYTRIHTKHTACHFTKLVLHSSKLHNGRVELLAFRSIGNCFVYGKFATTVGACCQLYAACV
jgi:hypothetical protein